MNEELLKQIIAQQAETLTLLREYMEQVKQLRKDIVKIERNTYLTSVYARY